jgi:hypothetical protein
LEKQLAADTIPMTLVFLGPLTNIAAYVRAFPDKKSHIAKIIWFCERNKKRSFNYYADSAAAQAILSAGIVVDIVNPCKGIALNALDNQPRDLIGNGHASAFYGGLKRTREKGHSPEAFDDFIPLYINYPGLFTQKPSPIALARNFVFKGNSKTFCERTINIFSLK